MAYSLDIRATTRRTKLHVLPCVRLRYRYAYACAYIEVITRFKNQIKVRMHTRSGDCFFFLLKQLQADSMEEKGRI